MRLRQTTWLLPLLVLSRDGSRQRLPDEGDACGDCGQFTMVRNGTCLKCDTCGATTGCS